MSLPGIISPFSNGLLPGGLSDASLANSPISPLDAYSGLTSPTQGLGDGLSTLSYAPKLDDLSSALPQLIQMILMLLMQIMGGLGGGLYQANDQEQADEDDSQQDAGNAEGGCGGNDGGNSGNAGNAGNSGGSVGRGAQPTSVNGNGNSNDDQAAVLDEINQFRAQNGLPPVRLSAQLNQAAQGYSEEMAQDGHFDHTSLDGTTFDQRIRGTGYQPGTATENIAKGQRTPQEVVQSWINSPGHRANLLNPNITEIGVGKAVAADGSVYWTQEGARQG